jgi:hypothetical protein
LFKALRNWRRIRVKKRILGIPLRGIIMFPIILLILIIASVAYNRSVMNAWTPPEALSGTWTGQSEVCASFKKVGSPSESAEDWIQIELVIGADKNVTGTIGDADLAGCVVKRNRTWFERLIGIKTDYVVTGSLENGIVREDTAAVRDISIPFDVSEGKIKGSVFEVERWKYPDPLFPRLTLDMKE